MSECVLFYRSHVKTYYVKDGEPTGEQNNIKHSLRPLEDMFGDTPAVDFGAKKLKLVREEMIRKGRSRRYTNASVRRIKRFFNWCAEEELIPGEVAVNLQPVAGLEIDRSRR